MVENKEILDEDKLISALGLAYKARKVSIGVDIICDNIRKSKTKLVILSESSSDNTKKKIINCSNFYNCNVYIVDIDKIKLGGSFGKNEVACVDIQDANFINLIKKYIN